MPDPHEKECQNQNLPRPEDPKPSDNGAVKTEFLYSSSPPALTQPGGRRGTDLPMDHRLSMQLIPDEERLKGRFIHRLDSFHCTIKTVICN